MLDFNQIKMQYPDHLQVFERAILREYLQYKILQAIFESNYASKLAFMGGTALRVFYGNNRFSEDIDLDNFGFSELDFENLVLKVKQFMELEGLEVTARNVSKGAFRCYLRFPAVLYKQGIFPHQEESVLIQIDTAAQHYDYQPEIRIINKFDVFTEVRVTPSSVLLSQKIFAAVNRKRAKGWDFFDIMFLFSHTKPDFAYLKQKMGIESPDALRHMVLQRTQDYAFQALANNVAPFLINRAETRRVEKFREFWEQVTLT